MQANKQAGFFLWETILLSIVLLAMTAAAGMYMRAALLQSISAVEGCADYLAQAQIAYAQALLDKEGCLPQHMDYLGDKQDLQQNGIAYNLNGKAVADDDGLWELQFKVSWTANGRQGEQEYKRCLSAHK